MMPRVMRRLAVIVFVLLVILLAVWSGSRSRTWQPFGEIVARVETEQKLVALTFDDGPVPEATEQVLAQLREADVRATFFLTGREIEANPRLARAIVDAGHELGNHSWSHRRMLFRSPEELRRELAGTDAAIRDAGFEGPIHFRPPYGKKGFALPWILAEQGRLTVTWDVEPDSDEDVAASAESIVRHVRARVRPGSIVLMHVMYPSRKSSLDAVAGVVRALREDGYRLVTVSELLEQR